MNTQPEALRLAEYWTARANDLQTWVDENDYVEFGYRPEGLKREQADQQRTAAELRRLHAENELLRGSLKKANDQAEHFEREWYLRGDEIEDLKKDAERFRFANDSEEDFAICYWDESMGNGGEWMCNGYKGDSIDLLDAAIAKATGENT